MYRCAHCGNYIVGTYVQMKVLLSAGIACGKCGTELKAFDDCIKAVGN